MQGNEEYCEMGKVIKISAGGLEVEAELNDSSTAEAIGSALPIKGKGSRWGGEIYFMIPVDVGLEEGCREVVEAGELGYWPSGKAFCIFFGRTPASEGDEIRAASAVNIVGRVTSEDLSGLAEVKDGEEILLEGL